MPCSAPIPSILTVQNGLPWWYFQRLGGQYDNHRLESLDPSGVLTRNIDPKRLIGCVVYPAAAATAPGVIHHVEGDRFPIGELDGKETPRVRELHDVFIKAGLKSMVLPDIRSEIWLKAWGNLSFNPISALTHATLVDICQFAETRELAATMMKEAQDIAQKLGVTFRVSIDKRIAGAEAVGAHKTSMLQDVEAGRSLETEALIGSILEMARLTNTAAPAIEAVYALVKLLREDVRSPRAMHMFVSALPRVSATSARSKCSSPCGHSTATGGTGISSPVRTSAQAYAGFCSTGVWTVRSRAEVVGQRRSAHG